MPSSVLRVGGFAKPFSLTRKVKRNPHYGLPAGKCADRWSRRVGTGGRVYHEENRDLDIIYAVVIIFLFYQRNRSRQLGNQIVFDAG